VRDLRGVIGWQKTSFIDFPGTVSTVLFFSGCNLRCPFCHNPALVRGEGEPPDPQAVEDYLAFRKGKLTGVVLSGGEPTLHDSAVAIARSFRESGYKIKLDTNGLHPEQIELIAPDYLALDIKTSPARYAELGCSVADCEKLLLRSIGLVRDLGEQAEIRTTIAPGLVDRAAIVEIGRMVEGVSRVFLQPMQQRAQLLDPHYQTVALVDPAEIAVMRDVLSNHAATVEIRGL